MVQYSVVHCHCILAVSRITSPKGEDGERAKENHESRFNGSDGTDVKREEGGRGA